jgi:hypothetical protein
VRIRHFRAFYFRKKVGIHWRSGVIVTAEEVLERDEDIKVTQRSSTTGGLEVYDINNNQITGAAFMGTVGLDWQVAGVGDFSSIPGETDMMSCASSSPQT